MKKMIQGTWRRLALAVVFSVLSALSPFCFAQTVTYFHNDAAGTPVVATDASGNVVWKESYQPYGARLNNPSAEAGNAIGFAGKPFDPSTGLSYAGARYYDPSIGRFMGVDPAPADPGSVHGFNRYAYANNNPYKYVDPDGHSPVDVAFLVWDLGKLGVAVYTGAGLGEAGVDVAVSAVGVLSPVPLAGEAYKAARALEKGAELAKAAQTAEHGVEAARGVEQAAKGSGQIFQRVVSNAELKATQETGFLRGGRSGENFFTDAASLDAKRAQQRLGLDGPLRDQRIQFQIKNDVTVTGPRSAASGRSGTSGGGREFSTDKPTQIEILHVDQLRR